MKLIRDLQREILDDSVNLSSTLRKAKVVAAMLGNRQFKSWVDSELEGYECSPLELPPYRVIGALSLGTFSGAFGSGIRNAVIPVLGFPEHLRDYASQLRLSNGIRELEGLAKGKSQRRWPAELVELANNFIESDYVLVDAFQPITAAAVEGILDSVRNRLLDFLLELQELDPDVAENEEVLRTLPADKVASTFNLTFYGDQNVVAASATGGTTTQEVHQQRIRAGNAAELGKHLEALGVPDQDVAELRAAIREDGAPTSPGKFGPRVRRWVGAMTEKVLAGTWKVALESAPTLLTKALASFYGWDKD